MAFGFNPYSLFFGGGAFLFRRRQTQAADDILAGAAEPMPEMGELGLPALRVTTPRSSHRR